MENNVKTKIRTRFAPSPTGFMHIGNLRSALYEYLIAKKDDGIFVLRIEDTDQKRYVHDALDIIYKTLEITNLLYDEGPDIGGQFGPYVQSQRQEIYKKFAHELIDKGEAYYCFCQKNDSADASSCFGYDRTCRNLSEEIIHENIKKNMSYVIRHKIPLEGFTTFEDKVYGKITVKNCELEDQILIKSDGLPTYNFANVIDDHLMKITHVVRGSEYLSSTPKYNLIYKAFGWEIPEYIHLPLILGKDEDGKASKLSKRSNSISFFDLLKDGFLPEAIVNYIVFLGWCPETENEIFNLNELTKEFKIERISKSPSMFDVKKMIWFNEEYIKKSSATELKNIIKKFIEEYYDLYVSENDKEKILSLFDDEENKLIKLLQPRISKLSQVFENIDFFYKIPEFDKKLFSNKKNKLSERDVIIILNILLKEFEILKNWNNEDISNVFVKISKKIDVKLSAVSWVARISVSMKSVTPGSSSQIFEILRKKEVLERIKISLNSFI